jgi:glycosyltransferase involved in cell wall biosynthesis
MRVLHLAAGNRWTGAAAPAFAEVEALRQAGVEAHYAYVGGYKLEAKIGHHDFAHAIIDRAQNPWSFWRSVQRIRQLVEREAIDVIHAHLTHDHWLARMAAGPKAVARTWHSRRVLRSDMLSRSLVNATQAHFVVNAEFVDAPALAGRSATFTPPPLDHRQFTAEGENVRAIYGLEPGVPLVLVIGKLSAGRGFEDAFRTFACLRKNVPEAKLMVIGHGEHRPLLETLSRGIGVANDLIWAGYHEHDLAEHYRAADLMLFTARGSDEGHRAVLEAMACGVPPVSYPIEGIAALAGDLGATLISQEGSPSSLAVRAEAVLRDRGLAARVAARSSEFGYARAAERLMEGYARVAATG